MSFTISIDTSKASARFGTLTERTRTALRGVIIEGTRDLTGLVRQKLSGGVLQTRSGRLLNSIRQQLVENPQSIYGQVWSQGVPYAAIHEFGGRTPAHIIEARNAKALAFMMGGQLVFFRRVHHPGSNIPERSYMRSSLDDMRDILIARMTAAVRETAKAA